MKRTGSDNAQERAVTADALSEGADMVSTAVGAADVAWAPLTSDTIKDKKSRELLPYDLKTHDVKAHLKDRTTAVVDMRAVVDAPHDVLFNLLADPHQHESIFEAIESAKAELVSEDGPVRRWRLDYRARWKFWKVGGVCDNRLWMTTDSDRGTVSFVLREPGFLRKYEGTWTITGPHGGGPGSATTGRRHQLAAAGAPALPKTPCAVTPAPRPGLLGAFAAINNPFLNVSVKNPFGFHMFCLTAAADSAAAPPALPAAAAAATDPWVASSLLAAPRSPTTIVVHKALSPKVAPPFPINQVLKGHACGQVNDMLEGLLFATARKISETELEGTTSDEASRSRRR
ncbi:hypothetical protein GPECTOR_194g326 [Gonium pectorale]|uniref:Coenzyme Q-binding protein COQ10 START domain-containing protein n=1 Tax=Gonium pectorale TaxID=33097 RepID=A0A150FX50_GONPE|nr:hypothetical protein GPECTOR_194g326 [Gonium pectorale]|eukprot:KXZ42158.1 hypothetical protein GPECTOR_194g326 [Gonium pectorale]